MRLWFRLWTGHIFLALTIIGTFIAVLVLRETMQAFNPVKIFWGFVATMFAVLMTLGLGGITAYTYRTFQQREYIRNEDALNQAALPPVDATEIVEGLDIPDDVREDVYGAPEPEEEVSRGE